MTQNKQIHINSISDYHKARGLPPPKHPLISVIDYAKTTLPDPDDQTSVVIHHYSIAIKRGVGKMFYGQQEYDFDEGVMYCMAPGQVLRVAPNPDPLAKRSGWILMIHPDFIWNTPLAQAIKKYEFFDYSVNEALFLSQSEEATINNIVQNIQEEYNTSIDKFSQSIIISQLETLLNYADRFYQRQFITRKKSNHQILARLEYLLLAYFDRQDLLSKGLPTVQYIAESLSVSPSYLSSLLKVHTGQSTQQHIHDKVIEKAKEKLSTTNLTVSEIAYALGFEHPQSFSKLFKTKTSLSPLEFRQSFN
jgi:AraC family transcriptional regulator, transcriptional activator of pobA